MRKCIRRLTTASLFMAAALAAPAGALIGNDFTYQGKLQLSGSPVTGTADIQYRLFTAPSAGTQIGATISLAAVNLVDGLLNHRLDFGAGAFDGTSRYLEIAVRSPANTGNFVILTPRQVITAAPYALK